MKCCAQQGMLFLDLSVYIIYMYYTERPKKITILNYCRKFMTWRMTIHVDLSHKWEIHLQNDIIYYILQIVVMYIVWVFWRWSRKNQWIDRRDIANRKIKSTGCVQQWDQLPLFPAFGLLPTVHTPHIMIKSMDRFWPQRRHSWNGALRNIKNRAKIQMSSRY
jgi:hypothetical protein